MPGEKEREGKERELLRSIFELGKAKRKTPNTYVQGKWLLY